jgi:hypothetical protein
MLELFPVKARVAPTAATTMITTTTTARAILETASLFFLNLIEEWASKKSNY